MTDDQMSIEIKLKQVKKYNRQGIEKQLAGDLAGAIADYDLAIEINPNYIQAYNNRGLAKGQSGDLGTGL